MQITSGSGNSRQSITIPCREALDRETHERITWNVKSMLFDRGVITSLK